MMANFGLTGSDRLPLSWLFLCDEEVGAWFLWLPGSGGSSGFKIS